MKETQQQERCLEEAIEVSVDTDFIKQFLEDEELNEVAVSGEVNKPNGVIVIDDDDDNDDGDCIVLDCDPENQVKCVNDSPTGSDELCVVGEKGKVTFLFFLISLFMLVPFLQIMLFNFRGVKCLFFKKKC
jgi:hypothetical protein